MKYVSSKFNFSYKREENENVIYNTFSKALVILDNNEYEQYSNITFTDNEVENQLIENKILVNESFDELAFLKYYHYEMQFSNEILFLTIAPTMDCIFSCPYCY